MRWAVLLALGWCSSLAHALSPSEQRAAQNLLRAYPTVLSRIDGNTLIWRDGTRMPLARAQAGSYIALLDAPGLLDELDAAYPACTPITAPAHDVDPGRARYEPLFTKLYGASPAQVRPHLEQVDWFGQRLWVTGVGGASASLRAVAAEIAQHPELRRYARPSAGAYLWRRVAGTPRRSLHSYGAAIDINTRFSDYWAWGNYREGQTGIVYRNRVPAALVNIFERRGWIWGGRWYHFDSMHFEFRPELARCRL